jgi:hypothetical protein
LPSSIAVCSDGELRTLATERQRAYDDARARLAPEQRKALLADQKAWVASYPPACGVARVIAPSLPLAPAIKDCMAQAGRARIAYLKAYAETLTPFLPPVLQQVIESGTISAAPVVTNALGENPQTIAPARQPAPTSGSEPPSPAPSPAATSATQAAGPPSSNSEYNPWYYITEHMGTIDCVLLTNPKTGENATPDEIIAQLRSMGKSVTVLKQESDLVAFQAPIGAGSGIFIRGKDKCEDSARYNEEHPR